MVTRYSEEYKSLKRHERQAYLRRNFNATPMGEYKVETKSLICNGWLTLEPQFFTIEDAKAFIAFYCVPNQYGTVEKGRIVHYEQIDSHSVKVVVDWVQE